jgi:MFS family permease
MKQQRYIQLILDTLTIICTSIFYISVRNLDDPIYLLTSIIIACLILAIFGSKFLSKNINYRIILSTGFCLLLISFLGAIVLFGWLYTRLNLFLSYDFGLLFIIPAGLILSSFIQKKIQNHKKEKKKIQLNQNIIINILFFVITGLILIRLYLEAHIENPPSLDKNNFNGLEGFFLLDIYIIILYSIQIAVIIWDIFSKKSNQLYIHLIVFIYLISIAKLAFTQMQLGVDQLTLNWIIDDLYANDPYAPLSYASVPYLCILSFFYLTFGTLDAVVFFIPLINLTFYIVLLALARKQEEKTTNKIAFRIMVAIIALTPLQLKMIGIGNAETLGSLSFLICTFIIFNGRKDGSVPNLNNFHIFLIFLMGMIHLPKSFIITIYIILYILSGKNIKEGKKRNLFRFLVNWIFSSFMFIIMYLTQESNSYFAFLFGSVVILLPQVFDYRIPIFRISLWNLSYYPKFVVIVVVLLLFVQIILWKFKIIEKVERILEYLKIQIYKIVRKIDKSLNERVFSKKAENEYRTTKAFLINKGLIISLGVSLFAFSFYKLYFGGISDRSIQVIILYFGQIVALGIVLYTGLNLVIHYQTKNFLQIIIFISMLMASILLYLVLDPIAGEDYYFRIINWVLMAQFGIILTGGINPEMLDTIYCEKQEEKQSFIKKSSYILLVALILSINFVGSFWAMKF